MGTRAAIYCRISSDRTSERAGVRRQEEDCRALCEQRGWDLVAVQADNDVSAFRGASRPGWAALRDAIRDGQADVLVAWHPDRLTRSARELEDLIDLLDGAGCDVATVQAGDWDLSTASGRMTARVIGAVARHESEQKAERIRRQRAQAAQEGRPTGGPRPFGYEPGGRDVCEAEAEVVRECAGRVLAGDSLRSICRDLNSRGIRPARAAAWSVPSLRTVLTSARVAGRRIHHGVDVGPASWPAILTLDEHLQIRSALGDPRHHQLGRPPRSLLAGLLRCGKCGETMMSGTRPDKSRRYTCAPTVGAREGCGGTAVVAAPLEGHVVESVIEVLSSPAFLARLAAHDADGTVADLTGEIDRLEQAVAVADHDRYVAGTLSAGRHLAVTQQLDIQLTALRRRVARARQTRLLAAVPDQLDRPAWDRLGLDRQRAVLAELVDHITIGPGTPGRRAFDAARATITWRA